jgi:phosphoserine aminotransferase
MSQLMNRAYNFGAGPAMLPASVMEQAQAEFLNWNHLGMSVMEVGHRTAPFMDLMAELTTLFREVLVIPDHYQVLFLGGSARTQFAQIPLNFLSEHEKAGYLTTGMWSSMAYEEASRLKKAYCVTDAQPTQYKSIPDPKTWIIEPDTAYLYYTPNETVNGIRCPIIPDMKGVPLIADMTSCLLTEPLNIENYGMIFAGAQKNIANAGMTVAIVRDDLIARIHDDKIPTMLDYRTYVTHQSMYATPPTFNCYLAYLMLKWIVSEGGLSVMSSRLNEKSEALYQVIDDSDFYYSDIEKPFRSKINVCFKLKKNALESEFLIGAEARGLMALKGHRAVGGLRASLYNAMPLEGVRALIEYMHYFAKVNA